MTEKAETIEKSHKKEKDKDKDKNKEKEKDKDKDKEKERDKEKNKEKEKDKDKEKDSKEIKKKCLEELKQYYEIKEDVGKKWLSSSTKIYLINRKWIQLWKKYINKEYLDEKYSLKTKKNPSKNNLTWNEEKAPIPISNSDLLLDIKSFYNDGETENPENFIIKQDLSMKRDIKMIPEHLWDFFHKKYGGGPKLCFEQNNSDKNEKNGKAGFQLNKTEMKLIFLPNKNDIIGNDESIKKFFNDKIVKSIFIEKEKLVSDLVEKIVKTENHKLHSRKKNFFGEKIKDSEIKIWFCNINDFSVSKFDLLMIDYYGNDALHKAMKKNNNNPEEAKNSLVKKNIDKLLLSPIEVHDFCDINTTKIDDIFPESSKPKFLLFIERNNLHYFPKKEIIEAPCSYCQKEEKLIYSCSCNKRHYCSKKCKNRDFQKHYPECTNICLEPSFDKKNIFSVESICGLKNLGNTCYMNTALQCINSCWELTNFFLRKIFETKINETNPLGYKGVLCKSYGNLLQHLWYGTSPVYSPDIFLSIISDINATFSGKNQQDAHEFLNFLIDGLHEDLNMVMDKPLIEEEKIKDVKTKAICEWLNFKRRNQSVLIKLFYGQFLSNISCPNPRCQNVMRKFEPFMSVSVPLTSDNKKIEVNCYFLFYDMNIKPIRIEMYFNSNCTIMALRNKISKIFNIHPFSFVVCKLDDHGELKYILNHSQLISTTSQSKNKNEIPYFLLQIDPTIFNNSKNNDYKNWKKFRTDNFEKLNDDVVKKAADLQKIFYSEDESGIPNQDKNLISYYQPLSDEESVYSTKSTNNTEQPKFGNILVEKYGLNEKFILVPLFINYYSKNNFQSPEFFMITRILFLKKSITCEDIHKLVFKIFSENIKKVEDRGDEFDDYFGNLESDMAKPNYENDDTFEFQTKRNYPYRLRYINKSKKKRSNHLNSLLPYNNKKLSEIIDELYPKNASEKTVDGTYFFLNENQRNLINYENKDFQLEMTWFKAYKTELYKVMNDFEELKFTPVKPVERNKIELTECFEYFMNWEKLDSYAYKCEACKTAETPLKKIQIYKCPYYLIIHLKRFIDEKTKINTQVNFPIRGLNLKDYVVDENDTIEKIYDLTGIMYHSGTLQYGHYYAVCYNIKHRRWFLYNDDVVREIKENEISIKDAYVLFYRRRGLESMVDLEKIYLKKFKDYNNKILIIKKNAKKEAKHKMNNN